MAKPSIAILTSGGDAPGMNAAVRAAVRAGLNADVDVYGVRCGYQGLIDDDFIPMDAKSVSHIINQGGTTLLSARCEDFRTEAGRATAAENLKKRNIKGLVVIGGDGSFTGALKIAQEHGISVVGVPATIDNDIYGTDFTIGFDTAVNTVMEAVDKIDDTAESHNRLFFIEVMGRDAGFIALHAGMASGCSEILIPEEETDVKYLVSRLNDLHSRGKRSMIVMVAEGDQCGGVFKLARQTEDALKDMQVRVTVLGHLQRGGSPTCADRVLACRLGVAAVEKLLQGVGGVMVGTRNQQVVTTSLAEAIEKKSKPDEDMIRVAHTITY
ncbi:6-phosphofructokinase [Pelagibaculum spongiae]|uniref:ATP-dependent 6-phosphofructokinase n=1 Tax=Pelagibaculum spongiae TaxID=2080658 RepID=A0A2V1GWA9_9GAMM|nr:6-phosphofructokinase [Pelagibaculum spongiae]PVZ70300.1 6-phosphofructokinase [Pelagibaculum spongiae]